MKIKRPSGREVSGDTYSSVLEQYNRQYQRKSNEVNKNPNGISDAFDRSRIGYSDKPRVKPDKIKGK